MRKGILLIFVLLLIANIAHAKKLWLADKKINHYYDKVDIYIDTTGIDINKYFQYMQKTQYRIYSKFGYLILLDNDLINKEKDDADSAIYDDINNAKIFKNKFKYLKERFGNYKILKDDKRFAKSSIKDSSIYHIVFDRIQNVDSVMQYLKKISKFNYYPYRPCYPNYLPNERSLIGNLSAGNIEILDAVPTQTTYYSNFHKNGFGWNIYALNLPLAWEITKGKKSVTVSVFDIFGENQEQPHEDLEIATTSGSAGNWIKLDMNNKGDSYAAFQNDDTYYPAARPSYTDYENHGITTLGLAIAKMNNDNLSTAAPSGGVVGTSPNCRGMAFYTNSPILPRQWINYDTDMLVNGVLDPIDVLSYSWGFLGEYEDYNLIMGRGVLMTGAAGNLSYGSPSAAGIGQTIYIPDIADPTKDYKILSVGAIMDGYMYNRNCDEYFSSTYQHTANYKGDFRFIGGWNYSPSIQKFDINQKIDTTFIYTDTIITDTIFTPSRQQTKRDAFIDVVSPGASILCPLNWALNPEGNRRYKLDVWGTSQATPQVAGIFGLMTSINQYLGVPLTNNIPNNGIDVQRKGYDIVTFTTKKIIDDGSTYPYYTPASAYYYDYISLLQQPYYKTQTNDELKRSWAQRMGFGLVDAYRAVAHSIRQKGQYEYNLPGNSILLMADNDGGNPPDDRGYTNPDGKRIMHWGSLIKEGTRAFELPSDRGPTSGQDINPYNVLDWGGVSLPGEIHNNQGVTRINSLNPSNRCFITVETPSILAIDGILISDQPTACHYVKTMAGELSESVILMEGLIKDVEITGNLKVGDLIIESSIDNGISGVPGCVGFQSALTGNFGEIYGEVFVNNKAEIYAWSNLKVQPGGYIHLNGEKDMYLHGFSIMTMRNNSGVDGLEGRKIVVEGQAELFIEDSAIVDIDCEINVLAGGKLTLGAKAVAKIKKLNIEAGATVTVPSGAVMALKDPEHIVNGNFYVGSEPSLHGTAKVIGKLDEHCLPLGTEKYANTKYISTQPVIYMKGNPVGIPYTTTLTINNSEFKNISINATDVNIPLPIYNSGFYTESRHSNPFFNFDYLISINYDNCQQYLNGMNRNIMFDNCQFIDSSAIEKFPSDQNNWNKFIYRTGGVLLNDCQGVLVQNTDFQRLEYGIMANNSIYMKITNCKFDTCGIGDYAFATGTELCQNEYNVVRYGSFRDNAYEGTAYNNIYTKTRLAYYALNSGEQRLRGNEFNQYYRAISSINTKILMQNIIENNMLKIYGMNEFYMEDQITPLTLPTYSNKFITKICEIDSIADVYTAGKVFDLHVECGRNKFSKYATYHFLNKVPGNPILVVKINAMFPDLFPLPCLPRVFGLIPDYDANPALIYITQWSDDVDNMRYPGLCCGDKTDSFVNGICTINVAVDYHCGEQMPLGLYSTDLLSLPLDGSLITNTTQNKLIALSSYLSNSENSKQLLSNLKTELFKTHLVSDEDKSLIRLCIDLKLLDSININDYQTDYVNNLIFKHSIYRKNNKNDLQSMGYMSMLSFLSNRYDKGCNDGISDVNESTESDLNIVSIVPNPATDIATLTFTAPNTNAVDIIISDIQGNTVFKETTFPTSNNNTYKINSKNMTPGVYLVTLSSNGHRVTEKLIVVK